MNYRIVEKEIPASTWAVFESIGPMPGAIQKVWKRIFSEWFPATGYEHADAPELEVYLPGDPSDSNYKCEVWIPIINK
jgi:AraC family transcriptional regulator